MDGRIRRLDARIERIKREIARFRNLHRGSLNQQYHVCRRPRCRCMASPPQKHGPYWQVSFTWRGKSTSRFVRDEDVPIVKEQVENYARFRRLADEFVNLSMELCWLELKQRSASSPRRRRRATAP